MKYIVLLVLMIAVGGRSIAIPPKPPLGFRWVVQIAFSDEFNGEKLDTTKWMNRFKEGWQGRPPAWFNPDAVWLDEGLLKLRSGDLKTPRGKNECYTMYGGAVSSVSDKAHFGYYECKAKASKIAMSTTFWLLSDKAPIEVEGHPEVVSYSQELDIQECVGGNARYAKFQNGMNCNTHFRYAKKGDRRETYLSEGTETLLDKEVSDDFHVYGAWWKSAKEVLFYANNVLFDTVEVRNDLSEHPFDRPMTMHMVTETYDWQTPPSVEELENPLKNTACYDWVRSYKLLPVNEKCVQKTTVPIYESNCFAEVKQKTDKLEFAYTYRLNTDCIALVALLDKRGRTVLEVEQVLLQGYGANVVELAKPKKKSHSYKIEIVSKNTRKPVLPSKRASLEN